MYSRSSVGGEDPAPRLFIIHAEEDTAFVTSFLLGALELSADEVMLSGELEPGAVILDELERGARSQLTLAVVSPAFLASRWGRFAESMAQHQRIDGAGAGELPSMFIPVLCAECELPLRLRRLVAVDLSGGDQARLQIEAAKLRRRLGTSVLPAPRPPCPYPGMTPFTAAETACFYGRKDEIRKLLARLRDGERELYVIGPSGSGKSSLVAAGLVPQMREAPERAGGAFVIRQLRPGAEPAEALAAALRSLGGSPLSGSPDVAPAAPPPPAAAPPSAGQLADRLLAASPECNRLLVIVDQLEELFAIAAAPAREAFVAAVRELRGDPRVVLLFTLRADFYGALMESALWGDLDGQLGRVDIGPLRGSQLREAIEAPARDRGVAFEPVLIARLLHDVAGAPGALPLLQATLVELWHEQVHRYLRLSAYEAMSEGERSGLAVTVARRADFALSRLPPPHQELARRLFLRLIQFGDGSPDTRRQQRREVLAMAGDSPAEIDAVIRHLADHRLLTTSSGADVDASARIDLAHEILLTAWPRLQGWIGKHREHERRRRELESHARWLLRNRGAAAVFEERELAELDGWLTPELQRELGLSPALVEMIAASRAAGTARAREELANRREAARRGIAAAQKELVDGRGAQAAPYLVAAREAGLDGVPLRALFRWACRALPRSLFHHAGASSVSVSPDGAWLATASQEADVLVWRAGDGAAHAALPHPCRVTQLAWSGDGKRLATVGSDKRVRLWHVSSGEPLGAGLPHAGAISALAWSPSGDRLATACSSPGVRIWSPALDGAAPLLLAEPRGLAVALAWSGDGTRLAVAAQDHGARIWSATTGKPGTPLLPHAGQVRALAWSGDGTRLATASEDRTARIWDAASGRPMGQALVHQRAVVALAWRADGGQLATASEDRTARVWDAGSGLSVLPPLTHEGDVLAVAWSGDGARVATASEDRTARVWDARSGAALSPPLEHQGEVIALTWSGDGAQLLTTSDDQVVRGWDGRPGVPLTPPLAHRGWVWGVAWRPDGTQLATCEDGAARVWDAATGAQLHELRHGGRVRAVAWSSDGARLATACDDGAARVWDAARGEELTPPLRHTRRVRAVAWSGDGTRLATASEDGTARIWQADRGALVGQPMEHHDAVVALAWSGDGLRVATASDDGTARIWDGGSGRAVTASLRHLGPVRALAFCPDGARLATGGDDKVVRLWSVGSGALLAALAEHKRELEALAWSRDGARLASASHDRTALVWDVSGERPALRVSLAHRGEVTSVAWSPDGARLATGSFDKTVRIWDPESNLEVAPVMEHEGWVGAVAWSPEGGRLASVSWDGTAQVWDASWDGEELESWRAGLQRCPYQLSSSGAVIGKELKISTTMEGMTKVTAARSGSGSGSETETETGSGTGSGSGSESGTETGTETGTGTGTESESGAPRRPGRRPGKVGGRRPVGRPPKASRPPARSSTGRRKRRTGRRAAASR